MGLYPAVSIEQYRQNTDSDERNSFYPCDVSEEKYCIDHNEEAADSLPFQRNDISEQKQKVRSLSEPDPDRRSVHSFRPEPGKMFDKE